MLSLVCYLNPICFENASKDERPKENFDEMDIILLHFCTVELVLVAFKKIQNSLVELKYKA